MGNTLMLRVVKAYDFFTIAHEALHFSNEFVATQKAVRFGTLASVATIAIFLVGGSLAPLESASVLHGSMMPMDYKKTVQHFEGGIIDAILVKDNDHVVEGQPLIQLRKATAAANQGIAATQYFTAQVSAIRLEALQNGANDMTLTDDMKSQASANPALQDIITSQQHLFAADRDGERDKLAMYEQQIAQLDEENEGTKIRLKSVQAQLGLLQESLTSERGLVEKGYSTRPRLLSLENQAEELRGKIGELTASLGKNEKNNGEIKLRISNQKNEFQSKNEQELRTTRESIAELEKKLSAAGDVLDRMVITAPATGVVNDLKYHTIGGVIPGGSTIMDIIPENDALLVDAQILPRDISRIHIGQDAKIMFSSYKSRVTPMIMGKVSQISADRIIPSPSANPTMPAGGYYLARVEINKADMDKLATPITLTPGMPVDVVVVDGKRSLLGYYIKPFLDSFHRAFREQ